MSTATASVSRSTTTIVMESPQPAVLRLQTPQQRAIERLRDILGRFQEEQDVLSQRIHDWGTRLIEVWNRSDGYDHRLVSILGELAGQILINPFRPGIPLQRPAFFSAWSGGRTLVMERGEAEAYLRLMALIRVDQARSVDSFIGETIKDDAFVKEILEWIKYCQNELALKWFPVVSVGDSAIESLLKRALEGPLDSALIEEIKDCIQTFRKNGAELLSDDQIIAKVLGILGRINASNRNISEFIARHRQELARLREAQEKDLQTATAGATAAMHAEREEAMNIIRQYQEQHEADRRATEEITTEVRSMNRTQDRFEERLREAQLEIEKQKREIEKLRIELNDSGCSIQ